MQIILEQFNEGHMCAGKDRIGLACHIPIHDCPCKFCTNARNSLLMAPLPIDVAIRRKVDENAVARKIISRLKHENDLQDKHVQRLFQETHTLKASHAHSRRCSEAKIKSLQVDNARLVEYNLLITAAAKTPTPTPTPTIPPPTVEIRRSARERVWSSDFDGYIVLINGDMAGSLNLGAWFFQSRLNSLVRKGIEQYYIAAAYTTPKQQEES